MRVRRRCARSRGVDGGVSPRVGTCTINANQAGQRELERRRAGPAVRSGISKGNQTITFGSVRRPAIGPGARSRVSATATSGLTVAFTSATTSVCTVAGTTVTFVTVGTCTINADQAGNANWNAAPQVQQSFTVTKGNQTITFGTVSAKTFDLSPLGISATASSGLTVAFTSATTSICTVSGTTVTFVTVGTCTINANQAGDANWNAAPQVQQSFTISKGNQTISFAHSGQALRSGTADARRHRLLQAHRRLHLGDHQRLHRLRRRPSPSSAPAPARSTPTRPATRTGTRHRRCNAASQITKGNQTITFRDARPTSGSTRAGSTVSATALIRPDGEPSRSATSEHLLGLRHDRDASSRSAPARSTPTRPATRTGTPRRRCSSLSQVSQGQPDDHLHVGRARERHRRGLDLYARRRQRPRASSSPSARAATRRLHLRRRERSDVSFVAAGTCGDQRRRRPGTRTGTQPRRLRSPSPSARRARPCPRARRRRARSEPRSLRRRSLRRSRRARGRSATAPITFRVFGPQAAAPTTCTSGGTTVGTATPRGERLLPVERLVHAVRRRDLLVVRLVPVGHEQQLGGERVQQPLHDPDVGHCCGNPALVLELHDLVRQLGQLRDRRDGNRALRRRIREEGRGRRA